MSTKPIRQRYRDGLDSITGARYDQKISLIGGIDPYEVEKSKLTDDDKCLPSVTYFDIINYLVNSKSAYTMDQLKAFKSLDSYNQFCNGWVSDVSSMTVNSNVLVKGRVRHSQRLNDAALKPWFIANVNGMVECGHCDCMAGLGETCSHVGALLFAVEHAARFNSSKTVTQEKAYWLLPQNVEKEKYAEISDIDFRSTNAQKRKIDSMIDGQPTPKRSSLKLPDVPEPTADDIDNFNRKLFSVNKNAAILSVRKNFQDHFIPSVLRDGYLPLTFVSLKEERYADMSRDELIKECQHKFESMTVTAEQCKNAEELTRQQSKCKEWHSLRTGRITASNMKAACSMNIMNPAISTVNNICGQKKISTKATQWGCQHEKTALAEYIDIMESTHEGVVVTDSGLIINEKYPHIGASPDALVTCQCCGTGVVEIKCPFSAKDSLIAESNVDFLKEGKLCENHKYSYQVQTQLLLTERNYCDFVVWSPKDLTIQRVEKNFNLHNEIVKKSKEIFINVILPELTGNLISRERCLKNVPNPVDLNAKRQDSEIICICQKSYNADVDNVVGCDNENCKFKWLHFECVNLKRVPKGKYYCPSCKPLFKGKK